MLKEFFSSAAFYARYDKAFHTGNGCIKMGHRFYWPGMAVMTKQFTDQLIRIA